MYAATLVACLQSTNPLHIPPTLCTQVTYSGPPTPERYIESLIAAEEREGVPSDRIVVAGFSQGGAVALLMLRSEKKLAGIVGAWPWGPVGWACMATHVRMHTCMRSICMCMASAWQEGQRFKPLDAW